MESDLAISRVHSTGKYHQKQLQNSQETCTFTHTCQLPSIGKVNGQQLPAKVAKGHKGAAEVHPSLKPLKAWDKSPWAEKEVT